MGSLPFGFQSCSVGSPTLPKMYYMHAYYHHQRFEYISMDAAGEKAEQSIYVVKVFLQGSNIIRVCILYRDSAYHSRCRLTNHSALPSWAAV